MFLRRHSRTTRALYWIGEQLPSPSVINTKSIYSDTLVYRLPKWSRCGNLLILHFFLSHTQVYVGSSDSFPLGADLQYSHISPVSPLCPLFSLALFAGSLVLSAVIGARGLPGATGAPGRVFCSSYVVLLVTGARRARAPPADSAWEESKSGGHVCSFRGKQIDQVCHFAEKCAFLFFF